MPGVLARVKELKRKFYDTAPAQNQPKIKKALEMCKGKSNLEIHSGAERGSDIILAQVDGEEKRREDVRDLLQQVPERGEAPTGLDKGHDRQGEAGGETGSPAGGQSVLPVERHPVHAGEEVANEEG